MRRFIRPCRAHVIRGHPKKERCGPVEVRVSGSVGITARQFNALRIQLLGKISAIGERIPLQIENLKKKIRKAKKVVRKLVKYLPVFVSMEVSVVKRISDRRLRAIGIDINPDQLVLAEVDRYGNFTASVQIPCVTYGKTQEQAKAILGNVAKQAVAAAVRACKPMVIERLGFENKRAALEGEGRKRARMLSSFAYHQSIQCLKAAAFRAGVEIIEVNPAFTSTIGAVNFAARYGISVHEGAAIAIARRSLNLSERPAKRIAQVPIRGGGHVTLLVPVRTRSQHVWSLWAKVARQIRAAHVAHIRLLPAKAGSTPGRLCCHAQCAT